MTGFFYKKKESDVIWWKYDNEKDGRMVFSFDKKILFNLYRDYPWKLTKEQKEIFDKENPFWANYFKHRNK